MEYPVVFELKDLIPPHLRREALTELQAEYHNSEVAWHRMGYSKQELGYPVFASLYFQEIEALAKDVAQAPKMYPQIMNGGVGPTLTYWWKQQEELFVFDVWHNPNNSCVFKGIQVQYSSQQPKSFSASPEEATFFQKWVSVGNIPRKGVGVVSRQRLPAGLLVGILPGKCYTEAEHNKRIHHDTSNMYAMTTGSKWVVDAECADESGVYYIPEEYEASIGHRVNEAGPNEIPSLSWVFNHTLGPVPRIELFTNRTIFPGQELLIDYGESYEGRRAYRNSDFMGHDMYCYHIISKHKKKVFQNDDWSEWAGFDPPRVSEDQVGLSTLSC